MILNIVLLFLVFGAEKKKINPYAAALIFGAIKGVLVAVFAQAYIAALVVAAFYAGLVAAFVYFLKRVDRRDEKGQSDEPDYSPGESDKMTFRWEYVPLVVLLLAIIGGEFILA